MTPLPQRALLSAEERRLICSPPVDWTQIEFVLDMEEGGRTRQVLDGWETIRFVMADEESDIPEQPGAGSQEREDEDRALDPERVDL